LLPSSRGSASSRAGFALSSCPADRWTTHVIPHLRPTRARPRRHHLLPLPAPPSSTSDAARAFTTPAPSMALTQLMPPLLPPATPLRRSPGPYKRAMITPALTAPHPLPPELKPPLFVASGAPPLRHPSVAGEHLPSTTSTGSSSPSVAGEHRGLSPRNFLLKIKSGN
jgi:hypothetical protein